MIYRIPRFATLEAKIRIFQYKLLNNVQYLNKKLFQLGSVCSFCDLYRLYISEKVALPVLNPQSAIFGFTDVLDHNYLLVNHLLLIFKYNIYNSRLENTLSFQSLKCAISQIKHVEETISNNDLNKKIKISNKWKLIDHLF